MYRLLLGAYLLFMVIMLMRCGPVSEIDELVKQTDKVQVVFYERLDAYTDVTARRDIKRFSDYILEEPSPLYRCGYDGYLVFFTGTGSVRMEFNLRDDCLHVVYPYADGVQSRILSQEGQDYLRSLAP